MNKSSPSWCSRRGFFTGLMVLVIAGASPDALAATSRTETPPVRDRIHDQRAPQAAGSPRAPETVPGSWKPRSEEKERSGKANRKNKINKTNTANKTRKEKRADRARVSKIRDAVVVVRFDKREKRSSRPKRSGVVRAVKLRVPQGLRRRMGDLYYEQVRNQPGVRRRDVVGPINIQYGKVVRKSRPRVVFYAIGDTALFGELFDPKLLPHVWRKPGADRRWTYVGATPRGLCGPRLVPRRLANAWDVKCSR